MILIIAAVVVLCLISSGIGVYMYTRRDANKVYVPCGLEKMMITLEGLPVNEAVAKLRSAYPSWPVKVYTDLEDPAFDAYEKSRSKVDTIFIHNIDGTASNIGFFEREGINWHSEPGSVCARSYDVAPKTVAPLPDQ
jgi:hypothetical protein